jgi:hypothetical protein
LLANSRDNLKQASRAGSLLHVTDGAPLTKSNSGCGNNHSSLLANSRDNLKQASRAGSLLHVTDGAPLKKSNSGCGNNHSSLFANSRDNLKQDSRAGSLLHFTVLRIAAMISSLLCIQARSNEHYRSRLLKGSVEL